MNQLLKKHLQSKLHVIPKENFVQQMNNPYLGHVNDVKLLTRFDGFVIFVSSK